MNDLLRRILIILHADKLTMPQRIMLWAIQDLATQEAPYKDDESDERLQRAYWRAVLIAGIEGVEVVWKMGSRDVQDTLQILRYGEMIERYAMHEYEMRGITRELNQEGLAR